MQTKQRQMRAVSYVDMLNRITRRVHATNLARSIFDEGISPWLALFRAGLVEEVIKLAYLAMLAEELDEGVFIYALGKVAYEQPSLRYRS